MSRRHNRPSRSLRCSVQPCKEFAYWTFDNLRDQADHYKRVREWTCTRHSHPGEVLSPTNLRTEWISEPALPSETYPNIERSTLFFAHSGFIFGNGYKAFASDFPAGTRIKVTAEVVLPVALAGATASTEPPSSESVAPKETIDQPPAVSVESAAEVMDRLVKIITDTGMSATEFAKAYDAMEAEDLTGLSNTSTETEPGSAKPEKSRMSKYFLARTFDQDLGLYRDSEIIGTLILPEAEAQLIVDALNKSSESEKDTARKCLEILQSQTYLSEFPTDDPGGCEGCGSGWCQSSVDAVCESRNRVADAIRKTFAISSTEPKTAGER